MGTVKATDELCTRIFAVHTLKSPPTKIPKFPDGGQTPPDGGGALAPLKLPLRGAAPAWTNQMIYEKNSRKLPKIVSHGEITSRVLHECTTDE